MFSPKRIWLALRAYIAELPIGHYLFGAVAAAVIYVLIAMISVDGSIVPESVIMTDYTFMPTNGVIGIIAAAGSLTASLLGLYWTTKELKEENRRIRLLALPISPSERSTAVLLMNWLYLPLISILPAFLTVLIFLSLRGEYTMVPSVATLWHSIPIAWLSVLVTSAFYLFPAIALPRRVVISSVALLLFTGFYLALTREDYYDSIEVVHATTSFDAQNVVGMISQGSLDEDVGPTSFRYKLSDALGWHTIPVVLSLLLLCAASAVGIHRKTA